MDFLAYVLIAGLAAGYLVHILLLQEKTSHYGPFVLKSTFVLFQDTNHIQPFALFDIIRLVCGAYRRVPEMKAQRVYAVRDHWLAELWTCPLCLSFWAAFLPSVIIASEFHPPFLLHLVIHLAIACIGYLLYDRTQE